MKGRQYLRGYGYADLMGRCEIFCLTRPDSPLLCDLAWLSERKRLDEKTGARLPDYGQLHQLPVTLTIPRCPTHGGCRSR